MPVLNLAVAHLFRIRAVFEPYRCRIPSVAYKYGGDTGGRRDGWVLNGWLAGVGRERC